MLGGHTACIDIAAWIVCGAAGERVEVCLRVASHVRVACSGAVQVAKARESGLHMMS